MEEKDQESLENEYERLTLPEFLKAAALLCLDHTFLRLKKAFQSLKNRLLIR